MPLSVCSSTCDPSEMYKLRRGREAEVRVATRSSAEGAALEMPIVSHLRRSVSLIKSVKPVLALARTSAPRSISSFTLFASIAAIIRRDVPSGVRVLGSRPASSCAFSVAKLRGHGQLNSAPISSRDRAMFRSGRCARRLVHGRAEAIDIIEQVCD